MLRPDEFVMKCAAEPLRVRTDRDTRWAKNGQSHSRGRSCNRRDTLHKSPVSILSTCTGRGGGSWRGRHQGQERHAKGALLRQRGRAGGRRVARRSKERKVRREKRHPTESRRDRVGREREGGAKEEQQGRGG